MSQGLRRTIYSLELTFLVQAKVTSAGHNPEASNFQIRPLRRFSLKPRWIPVAFFVRPCFQWTLSPWARLPRNIDFCFCVLPLLSLDGEGVHSFGKGVIMQKKTKRRHHWENWKRPKEVRSCCWVAGGVMSRTLCTALRQNDRKIKQ